MATTNPEPAQPPVPPVRAPTAVLLLGSGGREHAIAVSLAKSPSLRKLFVAPGNAATAQLASSKLEAQNVILKSNEDIVSFCSSNAIDLVVVGPEAPLADGIAGASSRFSPPHLGSMFSISGAPQMSSLSLTSLALGQQHPPHSWRRVKRIARVFSRVMESPPPGGKHSPTSMLLKSIFAAADIV